MALGRKHEHTEMHIHKKESPLFQILSPNIELAQDALGLWNPSISRNSTANLETRSITWRAELPNNSYQAIQAVDGLEKDLQASRLALDFAPRHLQSDLNSFRPKHFSQPLNFALEEKMQTPSESILMRAWLYRLDTPNFSNLLDFGEVRVITQTVGCFLNQVKRLVGQLVLVETNFDGVTYGKTRVTWNGDIETLFTPRIDPWQINQHNRLIKQALHTRQAWFRIMLLFSTAIVRVGIMLSVPTFFPLTIWTTWSYIQSLMKEYRLITTGVDN